MQGKEVFARAEDTDKVSRVLRYSGRLDGAYLAGAPSLDALYVTAGGLIAVTVTAAHPFVEWRQRATRALFWQAAPFVFPALRKVRVEFGARARWSRQPVAGMQIIVDLQTVPRPPPPPIVPWEWCEGITSFALRVIVRSALLFTAPLDRNPEQLLRFFPPLFVGPLAMRGVHVKLVSIYGSTVRLSVQTQLVDHVIESSEPCVTEAVPDHFEVATGEDGLCELWLPPGAQASVQCLPPPSQCGATASEAQENSGNAPPLLAAAEPERLLVVSHRHEQFVGFHVFQRAALRITVRELGSSTRIPGVRVRVTLIEDERGATVTTIPSNSQPARQPVLDLVTGPDGTTPTYHGRAGALVRADVVDLPAAYLHMRFLDRVLDQPHTVRLAGSHSLEWQLPRKPKVMVQVHDAASGERVLGVRFRILVQPHAPAVVRPRVSFGAHVKPLAPPVRPSLHFLPFTLPCVHHSQTGHTAVHAGGSAAPRSTGQSNTFGGRWRS